MNSDPRSVLGIDSTYSPKDFGDDIVRYRNEKGFECGYMPSRYSRPDYTVLTGGRLQYYFWWRANLRNGKLLRSDRGYEWLYCMELINSREEPESVLAKLIEFVRIVSVFPPSDFAEVPAVYAISHRLRTPIPDGLPFSRPEDAALYDLTRYPPVRPNDRVLLKSVSFEWRRFTDLDDEQFAKAIFLSLAGLEETSRSRGESFVGKTVGEAKPVTLSFPASLRDFSSSPLRLPWWGDGCRLNSAIDQVAKLIVNFLRSDRGRFSVSLIEQEGFAEAVAVATDCVVLREDWNPSVFRKEEGGFWEDYDIPLCVREKPVIHDYCRSIRIPTLSMESMEAMRNAESDIPVPYVPAMELPTYAGMSEGQLEYYVYWRTMLRRGVAKETDTGYVWLYCCEVANADRNHETLQKEIENAVSAYGGNMLLRKTMMHHALQHGFDPPGLLLYLDKSCFFDHHTVSVLKLRRKPIGRVYPQLAALWSGYSKVQDYADDYELYTEVFTEAFRAVDDCLNASRGKRLIDFLKYGIRKKNVTLYKDLWTPQPVSIEIEDAFVGISLVPVAEGTVKCAIRSSRRRMGKSCPRVDPEFPKEYADTIDRAVGEVMDNRTRAERLERLRTEAATIVIDRDGVEKARTDLEAVTGMMASEEEYVEIEQSSESVGTGWDALRASLTEDEIELISASLSGRRPNLSHPEAVEKELNEKAMDTVGDAVMEDGTLYDEYVDEVRRMTE